MTEYLKVVDSTGNGRRLKVIVRDRRDGNTYRVDLQKNLIGQYKLGGGGGYRPKRKEQFEAAKGVAATWVEDTLNHEVVPHSEWELVKESTAAKILEESDEYEVRKVEDTIECPHCGAMNQRKAVEQEGCCHDCREEIEVNNE